MNINFKPMAGAVAALGLSALSAATMSAGIPVEATTGLPGSTDTRILKTSALPDDWARAGQFTGTVNKINGGAPGPGDPVLVGNSPKFFAWCLEPSEWLASPADYMLSDLSHAPVLGSGGTMGARGMVDDMQRLFGGLYPTFNGMIPPDEASSFESMGQTQLYVDAFQLAVWEIANETVRRGRSIRILSV